MSYDSVKIYKIKLPNLIKDDYSLIMQGFRQQFIQKLTQFQSIVFWLCWWLTWVAGSVYLLRFFKANHYYNFEMTCFYFAVAGFSSLWLYQEIFLQNLKKQLRPQLEFIGLSFVVFFLLGLLLDGADPLLPEIKEQIMKSEFYFPLLAPSVLLTKAFDILFQQILIYALVRKLCEFCRDQKEVILLFTAVFTVVHLPLFLVFGWFALYFIIPSIAAGVVFSYFILYHAYGATLSVLTHQAFYLSIAIYIRYNGI